MYICICKGVNVSIKEINMNTQTKEDTVTISKKEYEKLINDSAFLSYLIIYGVDNWEGYNDSYQDYNGWFNCSKYNMTRT